MSRKKKKEVESLSAEDQVLIAAELGGDGVNLDAEVFAQVEDEVNFLEARLESPIEQPEEAAAVELEGTELDSFASVEIEEVEFVEDERLESIIESVLFASDRPVSINSLKALFEGTNIKTDRIRRTLEMLAVEYAGARRGITLEEAPGGFQLRTKMDNLDFLRRGLKSKPFKLSGPALEVLSIVAYKQPLIKSEIDQIRGVESGHLLRALMEKGLVNFEGKSELPGRPMQYGTTRKFLEIFGLRNLKELPTLSQIDELIPEGIGDESDNEKPTLATITDSMSETIGSSYSQGEEELNKIQEQLTEITTTTQFFEEEKRRQAEKRDSERAQSLREALLVGEEVSNRDKNWLKKYDEALSMGHSTSEIAAAIRDFDQDNDLQKSSSDEAPSEDVVEGLFEEEAETLEESEGLLFADEADDVEDDEIKT